MGVLLVLTPKPILILICWTFSIVAFWPLSGRRRLVRQNLKLCFPELGYWELYSISLISFSRSIEQGLLVLAWRFLTQKKIKKYFTYSGSTLEKLNQKKGSGSGALWLVPHFCHADALSFLASNLPLNALFRPLRNSVFNDLVKTSRERFGLRAIDRKDGGMLKTLKVLKRGDALVMLFDQNAGGAGTRIEFMGRECSCTTLPDILYTKYKPKVLFVYTRRTGFWKSSIEVEEMDELVTDELVIEKANRWLENKLRNDIFLRESWLWMHHRWKPGAGKPRKGKIR